MIELERIGKMGDGGWGMKRLVRVSGKGGG